MVFLMRSAGILLPVFSLPGNEGIGTLGENAYSFIDFLFESKQKYWHLPPISHVNSTGSPYCTYSILAGNIYLIDIKKLVEQNLLDKKSYQKYIKNFYTDNLKINYKKLDIYKFYILEQAFKQSYNKIKHNIEKFRANNSFWLEDYTLYICLKKYVFENKPWQQWDDAVKNRKKLTLDIYKEQLKDKIDFWVFLQYLFYSQWFALKKYANSKNIKILGEFPFYCELDSANVWAKPNLFMLDKDKHPTQKLFHEQQVIYNKYSFNTKAVYNLKELKKTNYRFLTKKIQFIYKVYDELIIDNFDQYDNYKVIEKDSASGKFELQKFTEKPGIKDAVFKILETRILFFKPILYDCNYNKKPNNKNYKFPIIKIMQSAFSEEKCEICLPHNYSSTDVIFTSSYVFSNLKQWKNKLPSIEKKYCCQYIKPTSKTKFNYAFITSAYQSAAEKIITPIQDVVSLRNKMALYNTSKKATNWCWRIPEKKLNKQISKKLNQLSNLYGR